ncbi:MAG TPA: erythromycin esterase family protein [Chitinophagaceae bacterium]|nr:erythromycin esterase family protein [Chitinophagaceae bacterium]
MINLKLLLILILSLYVQIVSGQNEIKKYVQAKAVAIASIDPHSTDNSDLEVMGQAIGNARIVMMGDQDHEDAPALTAKTRIIKYLHEKMGFNVIAFENSFIESTYYWNEVISRKLPLDSFVKKYISITWRSCGTSPLFHDYLPSTLNTSQPLHISGVDNVNAAPYTVPLLDSMLRVFKIPLTQTPEYTSEIVPLLSNWYKYTSDSTTTDKIIGYYEEIRSQLLERMSKDDFWIVVVDNQIALNKEYRNWRKNIVKDRNVRDQQMARNLKWLAEVRYPNEKIIVLAHNYHVSKHSGHYRKGYFLNKVTTMGSYFTADTAFRDKTYIIGFTSYKGTAGRSFEKKYTVQKPRPNSFENWIREEYNFAFVDFKEYNASYPQNSVFFMKGCIGPPHHTNREAEWNRIFDGVFYIRDTYPLIDTYPCGNR